jgi:hypothetical protein
VLEGEAQSVDEIAWEERRLVVQVRCFLQGPEEALDEGDGAGLADGAVPGLHAAAGECPAEGLRGELGPPVGDEVRRCAEPSSGGGDEPSEGGAGRFEEEDASRQGSAREYVEEDGELEGEEAKEAGNSVMSIIQTW